MMTGRLEEGVILSLKLKRQQQLERMAVSKCFKRKDLSYMQAVECHTYLVEKDYKLNLLNKFTDDHFAKHLVDLERCHSGPEFESMGSLAEKDRYFVECKRKWHTNMMQNVIPELEAKAMNTLN